MAKRKKRLEKQIIGLEKQIEKHQKKLENEAGRKSTTKEYWRGEIERFEEQKKEREALLGKLKNKKGFDG